MLTVYAKVFVSLYQGTLRGNAHGILVFTNLMAHADKNGYVDIHPRAIAEEVGLPIESVKAALLMLEAPDDESRSPEEEGRRIVRLDQHRAWGWRLVNHSKYQAIRSEEDRREQNRVSQGKHRAKNNKESESVSNSKQPSAESAHIDVDVDVDTDVKDQKNPQPAVAAPASEKPKRTKRDDAGQTFAEWAAALAATTPSTAFMPDDDPLFAWAANIGVPSEWVWLAWDAFEAKFHAKPKHRQADWRQTFRNYTQSDWLKVWRTDNNGPVLTTLGHQLQRAYESRTAHAA